MNFVENIRIENPNMNELVTYILVVGGIILALLAVFILKIMLKTWIRKCDERKTIKGNEELSDFYLLIDIIL